MNPALGDQVRDRLHEYLDGSATLGDFEDWLVANTWNIQPQSDSAVADLVYEIELRLAEYTNGDRTEDELKTILQMRTEVGTGYFGEPPLRIGSSSTTVIWMLA